jgi:hypothetical protein
LILRGGFRGVPGEKMVISASLKPYSGLREIRRYEGFSHPPCPNPTGYSLGRVIRRLITLRVVVIVIILNGAVKAVGHSPGSMNKSRTDPQREDSY